MDDDRDAAAGPGGSDFLIGQNQVVYSNTMAGIDALSLALAPFWSGHLRGRSRRIIYRVL
ncbi:hypothetical protein GCM10011506_44320 [Marivirga lumbricoides]|uniref:Uncharacterized protein n=1 Tax=Marivirga lumbricoides TaxID=1046115 RepID=A0ABQ1N906_9BACT|nr:hypothetical protein GCM10011506_44320 [Marivirga lumbricoides]